MGAREEERRARAGNTRQNALVYVLRIPFCGITYEGEVDPSLPREIAWPEAIGRVAGVKRQLFRSFRVFGRIFRDDGVRVLPYTCTFTYTFTFPLPPLY